MVVTNPAFVREGHVSLVAQDVRKPAPGNAATGAFQGYQETGRTDVAAAVLEPVVEVQYYGVVSPEAAAAAGANIYADRFGSMYVERGA